MPKETANKRVEDHPNIKARVMPHNYEAEQAVLGSVLIDNNAALYCLNILKDSDFYNPANREIFASMYSLYLKNTPIDMVTVNQELETLGTVERAGGITYLVTLSNIVPSAANHRHYADIVKKTALLRGLIGCSQSIMDRAYSGDGEDKALEFAEGLIFGLAETRDRSSLDNINKSLSNAIERMELLFNDPKAARGLPTGFSGLDRKLNGLQKGDLVLIGARPGQGKTSIGMNMITNAALNFERKTATGKPDPYKCAVFSLEMPSVQLAKRMLCSVSGVDMSKASRGELTTPDFIELNKAKKKLADAHIFVDDSSLTTPMEILSKCRRLKREQGLDLVMIDYLQLMSSGKSRPENRNLEISDITRTLKIAAKELEVPVLLLSQLSRESAKRESRRPQLTDLRESGAIEQDADIVMFIYREHEPTDETVDAATRNKVEIIIAKHRNGETGMVELKWNGPTVSFVDPFREGNIGKHVLQKIAETVEPPPEKNDKKKGGGIFKETTEKIISAPDIDYDAPPPPERDNAPPDDELDEIF